MVLLDEEQALSTHTQSPCGEALHKDSNLYSEDSMESVAIRFRQQINENGKMLCLHHVIPK